MDLVVCLQLSILQRTFWRLNVRQCGCTCARRVQHSEDLCRNPADALAQ